MFGIKTEEKQPIPCFQALQDEGGEWEQKRETEKQGNSCRSVYSHPGKPTNVSVKSTKLMHANVSDCVITVTQTGRKTDA